MDAIIICLVICTITPATWSLQSPFQCVYIKDMEYDCDYSAMTTSSDRPIPFNDFDPEPQILAVSVNGYVPYYGDTQTFSSDFSTINIGGFDSNFPATLTINCDGGGALFTTGAFYNMSHVQHLKMRNCIGYSIPAYMFSDFVELDYFGIWGGSIDDVDPNGFAGLSVEKLTAAAHSIPRNLGHFDIRYSTFVSQVVPPGLLYSWKNLTSATLMGSDIGSVTADLFRYNTKLVHIDISDNTFTGVPSGLWNGLDSLAEFHTYDINWDCTCENIWFVGTAYTTNVTLFGDNICSATGKSIVKYYYENCVTEDICGEETGIAMGKQCVSVLGLMVFFVALFALVVAIVALVFAIQGRKAIVQIEERRTAAKGRWNKVIGGTASWNNANKQYKK